MSLTQNPWVVTTSTSGKFMVAKCTTACDATLLDEYTLKTPAALDTSRPYTLFVSAAATKDGQAVPLDLWLGFSDNFVISGNNTSVVAVDGAKFKRLTDDVVLAVGNVQHAFLIDPNLPVADVVTVAAIATGYKVRCAPAPYHAFHLDGGTALSADLVTWTIVQHSK